VGGGGASLQARQPIASNEMGKMRMGRSQWGKEEMPMYCIIPCSEGWGGGWGGRDKLLNTEV
jgi:hypothetical protein